MVLPVILQARKNFHWMGDLVGVRIIKMDLTMYLLMEKSLAVLVPAAFGTFWHRPTGSDHDRKEEKKKVLTVSDTLRLLQMPRSFLRDVRTCAQSRRSLAVQERQVMAES